MAFGGHVRWKLRAGDSSGVPRFLVLSMDGCCAWSYRDGREKAVLCVGVQAYEEAQHGPTKPRSDGRLSYPA